MRECADCGSNNIVRNTNTEKMFCNDCKSERVYGECAECGEPIKEEGCSLVGHYNWHRNNSKYKLPNSEEMVSCREYYELKLEAEAMWS